MQRRLAFVFVVVSLTSPVLGAAPAAADAPGRPSPRRLAPGVLTVIPPAAENGETFSSPQPLVELATGDATIQWSPNFTPKSETLREMASRVILRREVWCLEFAFKPLRMIRVDVPQPSGKMQRKLIWYMVYRVRYTGDDLRPAAQKDKWGHTLHPTVETIHYESRRFFPQLVLESRELGKAYLDRVIPAAKEPIRQRETPNRKLYDTVELMKEAIGLSDDQADRAVWGLATWENIDPQVDFLSVFVGGLTNACRFEDPPDAYKAGDPPGAGRRFQQKVLQLNFWRPGDKVAEHEEEIRYGVPFDDDPVMQKEIVKEYGIPRRLDYLWVYR